MVHLWAGVDLVDTSKDKNPQLQQLAAQPEVQQTIKYNKQSNKRLLKNN
jgi:hypothetical protein